MEGVAIIQRTEDGWADLLKVRVGYENDEVVALLVFATPGEATEYIDLSEGLEEKEGWQPSPVGLGDLAVLCASLGIGYVAFPTGPGLGGAGVEPVLDVVDTLTTLS